jgi:hypothetical protein
LNHLAVGTDQAPKGEAVKPAKPAGTSSDHRGGRVATLLVLLCPLAATGAEVIPLYDPLYFEVFGTHRPDVSPPAAGGGREAGARRAGDGAAPRLGAWTLRANSMQPYAGGLSVQSTAAEGENWRFEPRFVIATPTGKPVALSREALARVWSNDLTAGHTLVQDDRGQIQLLAGVKLGGYVEGGEAAPLTADGYGSTLTNTALGPSLGSGTLVGPTLGIAGDRRVDKHRLSGLFQQSMLYGQAELTRSTVPGAATEELRSGVQSYIERRDVNVSVSELGIKYLYELSDNVAFGMGAMASVWWETPSNAMDGGGRVSSGSDTFIYLGGMGTLEMQF